MSGYAERRCECVSFFPLVCVGFFSSVAFLYVQIETNGITTTRRLIIASLLREVVVYGERDKRACAAKLY